MVSYLQTRCYSPSRGVPLLLPFCTIYVACCTRWVTDAVGSHSPVAQCRFICILDDSRFQRPQSEPMFVQRQKDNVASSAFCCRRFRLTRRPWAAPALLSAMLLRYLCARPSLPCPRRIFRFPARGSFGQKIKKYPPKSEFWDIPQETAKSLDFQ